MNSSVPRVSTTSTPGCLASSFFDAQRDVEHELGFVDAVGARAWIVAAVSGVDDDARDAEAELPGEGIVAAARRRPAGAGFAATAVARGDVVGRVPPAAALELDARRAPVPGASRRRLRPAPRPGQPAPWLGFDVDDEAERVVEREGAVARRAAELEHDARDAGRRPADPDGLRRRAADAAALERVGRSSAGVREVEEDRSGESTRSPVKALPG